MEYHGCGEEYSLVKTKKGKQIHLPYESTAVRKNIKWGRRNGTEILGKKNQDLKKMEMKELYTHFHNLNTIWGVSCIFMVAYIFSACTL